MDMTAWKNQFDCLYTPHIKAGRYPENAQLALSWPGQWSGRHFDLSDELAVEQQLERIDASGKDIYFRISPMIKKKYEGRGAATDGYGLPCLFADIDTTDGLHKAFKADQAGFPHPTREQALELAESFAPPTLVINSGGGLHAYWRLEELLTTPILQEGKFAGKFDPDSDAFMLLERFEQWLVESAHARGFGIDKGVAKDRARVLRVAGSHNFKRTPEPVTVMISSPGTEYSLAWLDERLPAFSRPERRQGLRPVLTEGGQLLRKKRRKEEWEFSRAVPVSFIMQEVFEMDEWNGGQWVMPAFEDAGTSRHAKVIESNDGQVEFVVAYDCQLQEMWGVSGFDESLTSWDLVMVCCGYEESLATVIAKAFPKPDDDLVGALQSVLEHRASSESID